MTGPARVPGVPQPGQRIGRYELVAELATGGMASVHLARATAAGGFDRLFAIKCIHPRFARDKDFIDMFLDEARIASRITHPNVCGVFDVGEQDGIYYLAMEYLDGEALSTVLRSASARPEIHASPTYPVFACGIVAAAAEGLHAAHELRGDRGEPLDVVHRDVSPHNVFVTYDGNVRVVDFGIARATGRLHKTLSGVVKGKVAYMAPEQLDADDVDRRADVWALGVTLWELLTCRRLFRREHPVDTMKAVRDAPVPAPSSRAPSVAAEVDAIVLSALSRDPAGRPATARELGRELRRWVASCGEVVGTAELAEWMESLFAAQREEKRVMIEHARAGRLAALAPPTERMDAPPADAVATVVGTDGGEPEPRPSVETRPAGGSGPAPKRSSAPPTRRDKKQVPSSQSSAPTSEPAPPAPTSTPPRSERVHTLATESVVLPVERGRKTVALVGAGLLVALIGVGGAIAALASGAEEEDPPDASVSPGGEAVAADPPAEDPRAEDPPAEDPPAVDPETPEAPSPSPTARSEVEPPATPMRPRVRERTRSGRDRRTAMSETSGMEAREPPPTAPQPPGTASVGFRGGWAEIRVDGRASGQTPARLSLPPGRHRIVVVPFGEGAALSRTVHVRSGETIDVVFP